MKKSNPFWNEKQKLKDGDLMPDSGQHFNKTKMANIPDSDLLWLYHNKKCSPRVRKYIEDNLEDL